jgi:predicted Zn finger-like uncharacterized protein
VTRCPNCRTPNFVETILSAKDHSLLRCRTCGTRWRVDLAPLERRRPGRPKEGDAEACPRCGGTLEFRESHRLIGHAARDSHGFPEQIGPHAPAWACRNPECHFRRLVRRDVADDVGAWQRR